MNIMAKETKEPLLAIWIANAGKGIEIGDFGKEMVIVNHTSSPYKLEIPEIKEAVYQYNADPDMLLPHSAVFILL